MQLRKLLVVILLLSSALTITLIPEVSSQQFTTSTNLLTSTWTQTSTYHFTNYYAATSTVSVGTSTVTVQMTSSETFYGGCYFSDVAFDSAASTVHIHFSGVSWMSFYILDTSDLSYIFEYASGACFPAYYRFQSRSPSSSGDFDVNLPPSDNPYLLFLTTAGLSGNPPTAYLTIGPVATVSAVTSTATLLPVTATAIRATTLTSFSTSLQLPQPPQLALALAVIAAVALGALFLYSRRKEQPKVTKAEKVATSKNFCIECGSELPLKSKFCNRCGTKQL